MALRGLMARMGAGGAKVDTVLHTPVTQPGSQVTGVVNLTGGSVSQDVERIDLALEAVVEVESGDHEWRETVRFGAATVAGSASVGAGEALSFPFALQVPWQAPFTQVGGWALRGVSVGVRTKVVIAGAVDPGDLDPVRIEPLAAQAAVLDALGQLGFRFKGADVEKGRLPGSELPFYQEVEFAPAPQYARRINELEVTFLAGPHGIDVVLEADRRGGLLSSGADQMGRLQVPHGSGAASVAGQLDAAIQALGARRGWF